MLLGFWFLMQLFSAGAIAVTASTPAAAAWRSRRTSPASSSAWAGVFVFRNGGPIAIGGRTADY